MQGDNAPGVGAELAALREERERARKEREMQSKKRRLALNSVDAARNSASEMNPNVSQEKTVSSAATESSHSTKSLETNKFAQHESGSKPNIKEGTKHDQHKRTHSSTQHGESGERHKKRDNRDKHPVDIKERSKDHSKDAIKSDDRNSETEKSGATTKSSSTTSLTSYKNDYSQHFVDTGQRPQNYIRDADLSDRFEEYPKLRELIQLKDQMINSRATPPMYLKTDLKTCDLLVTLGSKFDVILIDPPWQEYSRRNPAGGIPFWTLEEMMNLKIDQISESPSFLWLWVGSAEGLDQGRLLLKKWGFRRCEDICWIKTNKNKTDQQASSLGAHSLKQDAHSILQHSKEHCLMGIKGTVRRNQDSHIIHANIDTDIIISEEPPLGSLEKPEELYHIIEHFSLGRRRLELFGHDHNIRPGWVTAGIGIF